MNLKRRYKLTIEDESHLRTVWEKNIPYIYIWLFAVMAAVLLGSAVWLGVITYRNSRYGTMSEANRIASERTAMRIDSINRVLSTNQAWINNFLNVTDISRTPADSVRHTAIAGAYNPDSLPDASEVEKRFVSDAAERERFNISVLAPLDADGMTFSPVAAQQVISTETRRENQAVVLLLSESPVQAIADGTVLAIYSVPGHGNTLLVQHGRGFVSSISHAGQPLVNVGDAVNVGQPLAFAPAPDARNARWVTLRIWHNGTSLIPYDIIP